MSKRFSRTILALALVFIAVAAPCAFWYFAGWRAVEQETERFYAEPRRDAQTTAQKLAERLRARLENLRAAEDKRPFYHYQNLIHDPNGASEGTSVHPSPLADGPPDPYVLAYFQIDSAGRLTLPTLNDEVPQTGKTQEELNQQRLIRKELEPAAAACLTAFPSGQTGQAMKQQSINLQPSVRLSLPQTEKAARVVEMKRDAWVQNQSANSLFLNQNEAQIALKSVVEAAPKSASAAQQVRGATKSDSVAPAPASADAPRYVGPVGDAKPASVSIRVGSFQWATIPVGGKPALAALRDVVTPEGRMVQGFVIATAAAADSLQGSAFPARFFPSGTLAASEVSVLIGGTEWQVAVDSARALCEARARATEVRRSFLRLFLSGVAAAAIAGLCVVGLVCQTERLARQRSQFAASAAHELRTPLAGLRMYSDMLAEGLGNPARTKEYARRIADEAERLGSLIANVLGFTRLERGILKIHRQPGDLTTAVRDCVARQRPSLEAAGATVELTMAENIPGLSFDPGAMALIIQNLLDNAEKHTRSATDRRIHVSVGPHEKGIGIAVGDHGPGIPARVRRRLFRPFSRGNDADGPAGLGLGLALAQALVRAHGGKLRYSDAPGGGAVFTAVFPM